MLDSCFVVGEFLRLCTDSVSSLSQLRSFQVLFPILSVASTLCVSLAAQLEVPVVYFLI